MAEPRFNFQWSPEGGFSVPEPEEATVSETPRRRDEQPFDGKLTQSDLLQYENLNAIRDYMVRRRGVQYREAEPEQVVDDFVENMRFFNTNLVSTAGEVQFINRASEEDKASAGRAYQLYDQLGSVFANDGFYGAVEGIGDYVRAAATDPSNYIGLLTGGVARGAAFGVTRAGKAAVKQAATEAAERAAASGATRQAADRAAAEAARRTADRLAARGANTDASRRIAERVARQERDLVLYGARQAAEEGVRAPLRATAQRRALYATTALDGTFAALNDYQIQNLMMDVGVQEEYSRTQTAFSSLLGLVGGGAQLLGRQATGVSGLGDTATRLETARVRTAQRAEEAGALNDEGIEQATKTITDAVDSWMTKVERGRDQFDPQATPADLIHDIMLGEDGKGGLAQLFRSQGMKLSRDRTVSDVMTSLVQQLPESSLKAINDKLQSRAGITLGETTEMRTRLGDLIAKDINQSARTLNVMSQVRRTIDGGVVHGTSVINAINEQADVQEAVAKEKQRMGGVDAVRYGQSVWRRLLVSSPATSMVNLAGFAQFNAGQTVADLFSSTSLAFAGIAMAPVNRAKSKELLRMSSVYRNIQAQKMRNFLDPYTTHDAYMSFLDQNKDVSRALFESFAGGVERATTKFNIDPEAKWFSRIETGTEAANKITGVRIQDSFTKSQIFMTELDKNLRLTKNQSLMDVLERGTLEQIDDAVIGATLDTTLKSVFSKDYTTQDQGLRQIAKFVEDFSNLPVIGTILPFGRFFNNTVAFAYQWGPFGLLTPAKAVMRGGLQNKSGQAAIIEATSRAAVGTSALGLAMQYDVERQKEGLGWNEVRGEGGSIVDARNTFPFSLFLAIGRAANLSRQGETVPPELLTEVGSQLAVGQFASDVQFGNDMINIFDTLFNFQEGDRVATFDAIYKASGNIAAGFTRPLDPINKLVGYIDGTDAARDLRQAKGGELFSQASTRYVDNIFEAMFGKLDAVTGEELRIATRQGEVYDANPMARIFGITVRGPRTATEQAYSMANMAEWTASERSNMAQYDRMFNDLVAPQLEYRMERLMRDERYIEGNSDTRRVMLQSVLREARKQTREYMQDISPDPEMRITALRRQANRVGNDALRTEAMRTMREHGVDASINDMGYRELQYFMDIVDYLEDYYKQ
jgi:hypothetical protein